jgi:hypothetical protein
MAAAGFDGTRWHCNGLRREDKRVAQGQRTARGDATTSWRDKTTSVWRNERTTRGDVTTSWHDKTSTGWHDKRQHNLVVFQVRMKLTGEVAAMVMLVLSVNQIDWALEINCK